MISFFQRIFGPAKEIAVAPSRTATPTAEQASTMPSVEVARLRLDAILQRFPAELKSLVLQMPGETVTVALPVSTILKQLASGSVKVSLATVHRQAPSGVFAPLPPGDKRLVEVPLSEVFRHVSPQGLKRRADQRSSDGAQSDFSLFGDAEHPFQIAPTIPPEEEFAQSTPPAEADAPPATPRFAPPPPLASEPAPAAQPARILAPPPGLYGHHSDDRRPAPPPPQVPAPSAPATPIPFAPALALVPSVKAPVPPPVALPTAPTPPQLPPTDSIAVPLGPLSSGWPEPIRKELEILNGSAQVALPTLLVTAGLSRGRVTFTWGQIREWLQPALPHPSASDDATELTLPLKIVAPVFLAPAKKTKVAAPAEFETDIPALFNNHQAKAPSHDIAAPVNAAGQMSFVEGQSPDPIPTPTVAAPPKSGSPAEEISLVALPPTPVPAPTPATIGELFGDPTRTEWSPADLVAGLAKRPGVSGAIVALQEGLLVAHSLPAERNGETIAAFLPQIFGRLNQYAGEMQFGQIDDLLITTHGAPCQIYRVGFVYFAVLGKPGETLPGSEMRMVANALADQARVQL